MRHLWRLQTPPPLHFNLLHMTWMITFHYVVFELLITFACFIAVTRRIVIMGDVLAILSADHVEILKRKLGDIAHFLHLLELWTHMSLDKLFASFPFELVLLFLFLFVLSLLICCQLGRSLLFLGR